MQMSITAPSSVDPNIQCKNDTVEYFGISAALVSPQPIRERPDSITFCKSFLNYWSSIDQPTKTVNNVPNWEWIGLSELRVKADEIIPMDDIQKADGVLLHEVNLQACS